MTPSILGFGMMRLKRREDGSFDEEWAVKTLRNAIDNGLSYVDTAYAYGDSERVTGLCLQDGYREKVTLATKMPISYCTSQESFDKILDEQLTRLQTDHIDAFLFHALNRKRWAEFGAKYDVFSFAENARAQGKIRYIGFSFHDTLDTFKDILGLYNWDFCQIQLNYMDRNYQAGLEGLRLAHERGMAVVIMEPLRGGALAQVPDEVKTLLPRTPVESALDFLWNMPEVNVVLSGMSETEQVEQNLAYANRAHAGMLTDEELAAIEKAGDLMREHTGVPCTGCNYCNICPKEIAIPDIFKLYNRKIATGDYFTAKEAYTALSNAQKCVQCGLCVEQCPQQIPIFERLAKIHEELG